jgi:outer membrane protein assembly factor BamB
MWGVAIHEGLVYAVEQDGFLDCIELASGKRVWRHDFLASLWGPPLVADGKVYVTTQDKEAVVLSTGRVKKVLAKNPLDLQYPGLVAANGELYVWGWTRLVAVRKR